jgi:microcystin-dependent protein
MEGTIGEVRFFASTFAPQYWAYCMGQLIAISSNTALFSILGTTFGGDGRVTFGLPDFRDAFAIGAGDQYILGEMGGSTVMVIAPSNMPSHTHPFTGSVSLHCTAAPGNSDTPQNTYPATFADTGEMYSTVNNGSLMAAMQNSLAIGNTGNSAPFSTQQPALGLTAVVCMRGLFPVRN